MAGKDAFSEQEWETLRKGVTGAGLLVSASDRGFFDSFKEAGALAKHLVAARKDDASELVRTLAEERPEGFGLRTSMQELESETLEALRSATAALEAKAPDELEAYREFVLRIAESVKNAAGGGDEGETAAIGKIRSALDGDGATEQTSR